MKIVLMIVAALALAGCDGESQYRVADGQPANSGHPTTYRSNGIVGGCHLYYVDPSTGPNFQLAVCDRQAVTTWRENCGKGCTKNVSAIAANID